jgi:hypothetical protein
MKLSLVLASVIHIGFLDVAFAHIPKELRHKLSAKSKKCIFIGYSDFCKAYQL